jgi:uncharacterized Fe-S cluster-containing radical SAM superfamily protein
MSDVFCIAPFVNFSTTTDSKVRLCCQAKSYENLNVVDYKLHDIWNSNEYQNARQQFINGQWPSECITCKSNEEKGISSRRHMENQRWAHLDINDIKNNPRIFAYDLRLGHTCNLKCIMCTPMNSSLWVSEKNQYEHLKHHNIHKGHKWADNTLLLDDVKNNLQSVQLLYFAGGEPLLIKKHKELIKYCIDNKFAKNISLVYDTNATQINQEWVDLWKNFKNVQINFSIDGGKEVVEYVRYPVKYSNLLNSLEILKTSTADVYLQMALGAYNIFEIDNIIELKNYYNCRDINISIVDWPSFMSLDCLTNEHKTIVKEKYQTCVLPRVRSLVNNLELNNNNPQKLIEYFKNIDRVRGLNYREVFKWL